MGRKRLEGIPICQALERDCRGGVSYSFLPFVKMHPSFVAAVLRQYTEEERKGIGACYDVLLLEEEEEPDKKSFFDKLFKKRQEAPYQPLSLEESDRLEEFMEGVYQNQRQLIQKRRGHDTEMSLYSLIVTQLTSKNGEPVMSFWQSYGLTTLESQRVLFCMYELFLLCEEGDMDVAPHPFFGEVQWGTSFQRDYLSLLFAYACRNHKISARQLHYLEQLTRQFDVEADCFFTTFSKQIALGKEERKQAIFELMIRYSVEKNRIKDVFLEDCIILDCKCMASTVEEDDLHLTTYLCPNNPERKKRIATIENKLQGEEKYEISIP